MLASRKIKVSNTMLPDDHYVNEYIFIESSTFWTDGMAERSILKDTLLILLVVGLIFFFFLSL